MEWQPIETAPKDGTYILVCATGNYHPITACWSSYHPNAEGSKCWRTTKVCGNKVGATYWMPLPPPPESKDNA